ncbi:MAG: hypothetical protein FJ304_18880 [Planctomycetes bacterium]|nr:hypothetical protein [Planctomycetota bacterium]
MKPVTGHSVPLTAARRMVGDILHASRQLPLVGGERVMKLHKLAAARRAADPARRPSWLATFVKGLARAADRHPELRRVFLTRPWHRLWEYNENVISVVVERECGPNDPGLFLARIHSPEKLTLAEIDAQIRKHKDRPIAELSGFKNALRMARLPLLARRVIWSLLMNWMPRLRGKFLGNIGISTTAAMGGVAMSLLAPWTFTAFYDSFADDDSLRVRCMIDHRVIDGHLTIRISRAIEQELNGAILDEVRALAPPAPGTAQAA